MRHEDNKHVILLSEVRQTVKLLADVLCFVLTLTFVFKAVVRVNHKGFDTFAAHKELRPFKNCVKPEIVFRADEKDVVFKVSFDLFVFAV